jgi:signal transduction histidine kinase/ligand-binding sensor domain-containing protein
MRLSWLIPVILLHASLAQALNQSIGIHGYAHAAWTLRNADFKGAPRALTQTTDGYLWLATEFGLLRFDGVRFVAWQPPGGVRPPSASITALRGTSDGSLWIGTTHGLARWKGGTLTVLRELSGHYVTAILEDGDGTIWVGTSAGVAGQAMLCAVRAKGGARCDEGAGIWGRFVISLHVDRKRALWVGAATGLWRWRPGPPLHVEMPSLTEIHAIADGGDAAVLLALNRDIRRLADGRLEPEPLTLDGLTTINPTALLYDRDGSLWIGTQTRGVFHVARGRVQRFTRNDGLSGDFVSDLFEDTEGNVWVATLDGLDRFHDFTIPTLSVKQGLSAPSVMSVLAAPDDSVWIGTVNGLDRWKDGRIVPVDVPRDGVRERVASLMRDHRGRIWVATPGGISYQQNGRFVTVPGVPGAYVHAMVEDRDKTVWVSDQEQGLFRLRDGRLVEHVSWSRLGGAIARTITPDPARGGLWLGFFQGGIAYFDQGRVQARYDRGQGVAEGEVTNLYFDRRGVLWIATPNGLSVMRDGRFGTLTEAHGLPCAQVHDVIEDDADAFWLSSPCGLAQVARSELDAWWADKTRRVKATVFTDQDGVPSRSQAGSFGPKVARATDGRLWFAAYDGVRLVDPRNLRLNNLAPPVHIERVITDGRTLAPEAGLRLPPLVRNLRIDFTAPSLSIPERVRFRYKLEGRDEDWVEVTNRREVFYTDLPPKQYSFRVVASNNDGVWNTEGATLAFTVMPAFYQTRAFLIGVTLLIIAALWQLYRFRLRRIAGELNARFEDRLAERARIAQALHDTLLQGFMSSSMQLDMIAEEVGDEHLKARLDRVLVRMRDVINEGRNAVQGLRPALNDLEQALARGAEELRGAQEVEVRMVVSGQRQMLHPLIRDGIYRIGREALANAFRHARARRVVIELEYAAQHVRLKISDDGQGLASDIAAAGRPGHWGIPGMRERAEGLGARLRVMSGVDVGTEVDLVVPASVAFQRGDIVRRPRRGRDSSMPRLEL